VPTIEMIKIEDIAHALSNQCRFGGHLPKYYSVAEHSLVCYNLATQPNKKAALLHDASEAYMLDIPRPIKQALADYKEIEHKLMLLIAEKFCFEYPLNSSIKSIDEIVLQQEWDELMIKSTKQTLKCYSPEYAESKFIEAFKTLK
jgi:5'-deoxynucleotidase YfbR-like HD superfamily hydrolase